MSLKYYQVEEMPEHQPDKAAGGKSLEERKKENVWQLVECETGSRKVIKRNLTEEQADQEANIRNKALGNG